MQINMKRLFLWMTIFEKYGFKKSVKYRKVLKHVENMEDIWIYENKQYFIYFLSVKNVDDRFPR